VEELKTFSVLFDQIVKIPHTKLSVSGELLLGDNSLPDLMEMQAIWDTGASGSCITTNVVKTLGLIPYSKLRVLTASGEVFQNVYKVCFHLPHDVSINIPVTEVPALQNKFGALVGMNIISMGDFTISNFEGRTCLSFRMPSQARTDYTGTEESQSR
jgi:predicted aspartyl protease